MKKTIISVMFATITFSASANAKLTVEQHCEFVEQVAGTVKGGRVGGMPKSLMIAIIDSNPSPLQDVSKEVVELAYQLDVEEMGPFPELVRVMCLNGSFR